MQAQTPFWQRNKTLSFLLGLGVLIALAGCALTRPHFTGPGAERLQPLTGDELVVGEPNGLAYVSAARSLRLRFHAADGWVPTEVIYLFQEVGASGWTRGPIWNVGEVAPLWVPPREGSYRVRGVPATAMSNDPTHQPEGPEVLVTLDWTPPEFNVGQRLPEMPVQGGSEFDLSWHVSDDHLASSQRVYLELSAGRDRPWNRLHEIPNRGHYRWTIPNNPLAGAKVRLVVEDLAGNRSEVQLPGTLTVTDEVPLVSTPPLVRARERLVAIPYKVNLPGGGNVARVELWVTDDDGETWRLAGYDEDLESPFEEFLDEGRWGFRLVVQDKSDNRSDYPSPNDPPSGELIVDWTPPSVTWGQIDVRRQEPGQSSEGTRLLVHYPFEVRDFELNAESIQLSYRLTDGMWHGLDRKFQSSDQAEFTLPDGADEPMVIRVSARDSNGNGVALESAPFYPSEILNPPDIAFDAVPTGWFTPGAEVEIAYHAHWDQAETYPAVIAYSTDQRNWTIVSDGLEASGRILWKIPDLKADEVTLRLRVKARDGRVKELWSPKPFGIDGDAPTVLVVGPRSGWGDSVRLLVDPVDSGGSRLDRLELWARAEGSTVWELAGTGDAHGKTVSLSPRAPGKYSLWAVAIDGAGNRSMSPQQARKERLFRFEMEEGTPGVRLASFQDGGSYAGGSRHIVFLEWVGPKRIGVVRLEYSPDDGGTWLPVAHVSNATDKHDWLLPSENIERCRLRVSVDDVTGARTSDQSHIPFSIDVGVPEVAVKSVVPNDNGSTSIQVESYDPGGAGVRWLWLFTSADDGKTWERWPEPFAQDAPINVMLPPGSYSYVVRGEDHVGNMTEAPAAGSPAQFHSKVGLSSGVQLALLHPTGGIFAGGSRHYVFWRLDRAGTAFSDRPVTLQYRKTDTDHWHTIASSLPPEGRESWYVPDEEGLELELRVVALDVEGQRHEGYSQGTIRVDSSAPAVAFTGPRSSASRPVVIDYQVGDEERLAEVEFWVRAVSTPDWKQVGYARAGEELFADIADGMYEVTVVAIDQAGNRTREPVPGGKGDGQLLVDTVAPLLEVDGIGDRQQIFHEGDWVRIQPRVQDRHLSSFPVSFRLSTDGGQDFKNLKKYHPNGDTFPWRLPHRAGVVYLEVTAEDLAGNTTREVIPIHVVPKPPVVTLLTDPASSILGGGDELVLEWETVGVAAADPKLTLEFTTDQSQWNQVAQKLPATGTFTFRLPKIDSNRCRLRLTVAREDGLRGTAWSGIFTISTTPPAVELEGVEPDTPSPSEDD